MAPAQALPGKSLCGPWEDERARVISPFVSHSLRKAGWECYLPAPVPPLPLNLKHPDAFKVEGTIFKTNPNSPYKRADYTLGFLLC